MTDKEKLEIISKITKAWLRDDYIIKKYLDSILQQTSIVIDNRIIINKPTWDVEVYSDNRTTSS